MKENLLTVLTKEEISECVKNAVLKGIEESMIVNKKQEENLTRQETADYLKITLPTLDSLRAKGILKPYKIGNRILFKRSEVDDAIESINY